MGYESERLARITRRLARVQATLEELYSARATMIASGVQSYAFSSGEGEQKVTRRSLSEINDMIRTLEAEEDHWLNEKYGVGLVAVRLRRKC